MAQLLSEETWIFGLEHNQYTSKLILFQRVSPHMLAGFLPRYPHKDDNVCLSIGLMISPPI